MCLLAWLLAAPLARAAGDTAAVCSGTTCQDCLCPDGLLWPEVVCPETGCHWCLSTGTCGVAGSNSSHAGGSCDASELVTQYTDAEVDSSGLPRCDPLPHEDGVITAFACLAVGLGLPLLWLIYTCCTARAVKTRRSARWAWMQGLLMEQVAPGEVVRWSGLSDPNLGSGSLPSCGRRAFESVLALTSVLMSLPSAVWLIVGVPDFPGFTFYFTTFFLFALGFCVAVPLIIARVMWARSSERTIYAITPHRVLSVTGDYEKRTRIRTATYPFRSMNVCRLSGHSVIFSHSMFTHVVKGEEVTGVKSVGIQNVRDVHVAYRLLRESIPENQLGARRLSADRELMDEMFASGSSNGSGGSIGGAGEFGSGRLSDGSPRMVGTAIELTSSDPSLPAGSVRMIGNPMRAGAHLSAPPGIARTRSAAEQPRPRSAPTPQRSTSQDAYGMRTRPMSAAEAAAVAAATAAAATASGVEEWPPRPRSGSGRRGSRGSRMGQR